MAFKASHRFARISPRKARLVTEMVQGMPAVAAMDVLKFTSKRASYLVRKVLQSAIANADEREANVDRLVVKRAYVDEGPRMKRIQPKDRGRAYTILKRTSHIHIELDQA
jgi:large subunit ribosomal protein L22